jgi:hypothetical protein
MNSHRYLVGLLALAITGAMLRPLNSPAQGGAGLHYEPPPSQFDNGTLRSKSALGQLEEMTGQKVQRPAPIRGMDTEVERRAPAPPPPPKPRYGANQAFSDALKNGMADEISSRIANAILNGGRAQQEQQAAQAAAARQAAAEEAARRAQEQAARFQNAQHYRADWDARQKETGQRLAGVFDTGGTAFFGQPNADAKAIAAILGDTRAGAGPAAEPESVLPDTAVVQLLQQPTAIKIRGAAPTPLSTTPSPALPRMKEENGAKQESTPNLRREVAAAIARRFVDLHIEYAEDQVKEWAWDLLGEGTAARVIRTGYETEETRRDLTERIGGMYTDFIKRFGEYAKTAARTSASPRSSDAELADTQEKEVMRSGQEMPEKFNEMALGQVK